MPIDSRRLRDALKTALDARFGALADGDDANRQNAMEDIAASIAREIGTDAQEAWIAPTLLNSWVNFGSVWLPSGYYKDALGNVHLRGLVKSGTMNAAIFTLPVGYRPSGHLMFSNLSHNGTALVLSRADVRSDGSVVAVFGANAYLSLSGISFRPG